VVPGLLLTFTLVIVIWVLGGNGGTNPLIVTGSFPAFRLRAVELMKSIFCRTLLRS